MAWLFNGVQNPLKFTSDIKLPHYGILKVLNFFSLLNKKVQKNYKPGIKVYLFNEDYLYQEITGL